VTENRISSGEDLAGRLRDSRRRVGSSWGGIHPARWRAIEALDGDATVLDVGCATGRYVERMRARGRVAWGTDLLEDAAWSSPWFFRSDACALPLGDGAVDCVVAFEVLEHLPHPELYLREFRRVARRKLIVSVPNCAVPDVMRRAGVTFHHWVDPTHVNFFTVETLRELLSAEGLTVERVEIVNPIRPELLLLSTLRVPGPVVGLLLPVLERVPWRMRLCMTILATASVHPIRPS
jgi:SAM-dependent methyltransferase